MKRMLTLTILFTGLLPILAATAQGESWPGWRGPRGDGTSIEQGVPLKWDPADAAWKIEIPGQGHASPIVTGDSVCTATALPATQDRVLLGLDRVSGKVLWQQTVVRGPLEKINPENSYASGTPATDGERVFAAFRVGDEIAVAAHDLAQGKQLWLVRPDPRGRVGVQQ
jgi:outer membrane protein assembly factor BamB